MSLNNTSTVNVPPQSRMPAPRRSTSTSRGRSSGSAASRGRGGTPVAGQSASDRVSPSPAKSAKRASLAKSPSRAASASKSVASASPRSKSPSAISGIPASVAAPSAFAASPSAAAAPAQPGALLLAIAVASALAHIAYMQMTPGASFLSATVHKWLGVLPIALFTLGSVRTHGLGPDATGLFRAFAALVCTQLVLDIYGVAPVWVSTFLVPFGQVLLLASFNAVRLRPTPGAVRRR